MSNRKTYHVTPCIEGGWEVKAQGHPKAVSAHTTKDEAVAKAKGLAKDEEPSQVIVHKQDGTFQTEYTYGDDPHPPAG